MYESSIYRTGLNNALSQSCIIREILKVSNFDSKLNKTTRLESWSLNVLNYNNMKMNKPTRLGKMFIWGTKRKFHEFVQHCISDILKFIPDFESHSKREKQYKNFCLFDSLKKNPMNQLQISKLGVHVCLLNDYRGV